MSAIFLAGLAGILFSLVDSISGVPLEVTCYYTNWAQYRSGRGKFTLDTYEKGLCDKILFAFAYFDDTFQLQASDPSDLPTDYSAGNYAEVVNLKTMDSNLKVLLSVGGYSFGVYRFEMMSSTEANRQAFAKSAVAFLRQYGFDGLDIDWEFPAGEVDKSNMVLLFETLRKSFEAESTSSSKDRLLLTAAVSAGQATINNGYDVPGLAKYADSIHVMAYDYHGGWESVTGNNAPLYSRQNETDKTLNAAWSMKEWNNKGMPKSQLLLGIPLYGRCWTLTTANTDIGSPGNVAPPNKYTQESGIASFYEILDDITAGATRYWNDEEKVPYLIRSNLWCSFEDQESIYYKANFVKSEGYAGAFVWTLDLDDFNGQSTTNGESYPLIKALRKTLTGSSPETTTGSQPTTGGPSTQTTVQTTAQTATPTTGATAQTTSAPGITTGVTMSTVQTKPPGGHFTCPGDGLFPDPTDCSKFYNCGGGIGTSFSCAPGLRFNPLILACDYAANVPC